MKTPIIKELWMLWNPESKDWAIAFDEPMPYTAYLCATSLNAIIALQRRQKQLYEITLEPVRVI